MLGGRSLLVVGCWLLLVRSLFFVVCCVLFVVRGLLSVVVGCRCVL